MDQVVEEEPFIDALPSEVPDEATQVNTDDAPTDYASPDASPEPIVDDGYRAVVGSALLASQCPYGMSTQLVPVSLGLWDCPLEAKKIVLTKPLRGLVIQADCYKKVIGIRTSDGTLDTSWEVMPDGTFFIAVDGGTIELNGDETRAACSSPLTAEIWGKLGCLDRDKVDITLHIDWSLQKFVAPSATPSASPSQTPISIPSVVPSTTPSTPPSTIPSSTPSTSPSPRPTVHVFEVPLEALAYERANSWTPGWTPSWTPRPLWRPISTQPIEINDEKQCKLPTTCHLYTTTIMKQCR